MKIYLLSIFLLFCSFVDSCTIGSIYYGEKTVENVEIKNSETNKPVQDNSNIEAIKLTNSIVKGNNI